MNDRTARSIADIETLDSASYPTRPVRMASRSGHAEHRPDGTIILTNNHKLDPYPASWNPRLVERAALHPDRAMITEADGEGGRRVLTFAGALSAARSVAQWLLEQGLDSEKPLAILTENSIACVQVTLGAMMGGIVASPISPSYALLANDHGKLKRVLASLGPGAVFVEDGIRYGDAVRAAVPADIPIISAGAPVEGRDTITLDAVLATVPGPLGAAAEAAVTGETIAKIMFTSGTSGDPKPVMLPHLMLAANRRQNEQLYAYLEDEPPIMVDWLPWHHTFGGNNNVGFALWCGGTLHIDDGKPTPGGIAKTIALIKQFPPTIYFTSPSGFEAMIPHLRDDAEFRRAFYARLKLFQYGGALLQPHIWKALDDYAVLETGYRILMVTGIGSTECGPTPMQSSWEQGRKPEAGLPVPEVEAKLIPYEDVWEMRLRGNCVTPGYWRRPDLTETAFDEEGFFRLGDVVKAVDPHDFSRGVMFEGRISDTFKLSSGTWVQVGAVRLKLLAALAPALNDAVITGASRAFLGAIGFPDIAACRRIAGVDDTLPVAELLVHPELRRWMAERLAEHVQTAGGSSQRVMRIVLEEERPTLDNGELTDKGVAAARSVLVRRAGVVEELHAKQPSARTISA